MRTLPIIVSDRSPSVPAHVVDDFTSPLISTGEHHLCPGCGEPAAMRSAVEMIDELGLTHRAIAVFGIGCYTEFSGSLDVEVLQALHGRAPSLATGVKRAKPETIVFTVQGDGDMVNEGLQEVIKQSADPAKPVAVNVIDFGSDSDRATWEAVAKLSGGSYQNLATSASPDLATAVTKFLS